MAINVVIKKFGAGSVEIPASVDPTKTVAEFKEQIAEQVTVPKENIRLVCAGRVWDDNALVSSYNPSDGTIIHCLNNPQRQAPPPEAQTLQPANPLSQMMGPAMVGNPGDPMDQMMAQSQQMVLQNPEMMQQIMNSPWVQQMLDNPEMLRAMMRMNPRMNELMETRPEIARMLDDPEMIRQSMRMMSNPSLMREMTRNADRALGNLDAMPGGHQALVRAHEEYIDPLYNAMSSSNNAGTTASVDTYTADSAPNTDALPNPWGPPPPAATPSPTPAQRTAPSAAPVIPGVLPMAQQPGATPAFNPFMPPAGGMGMGMGMGNAGNQQGANPMQQMMQQMMQNPAMMQMAQNMARNMAQQQQTPQAGGFGAPGTNPMMGAPGNPMMGVPGANPMMGVAGANPMMGMGMNPFQQMMMQQMMNPAGASHQGQSPVAGVPAMGQNLQRVRFASQLQQLAGMGFTDESACLRALVQNDGRLDAAIDVLLAGAGE